MVGCWLEERCTSLTGGRKLVLVGIDDVRPAEPGGLVREQCHRVRRQHLAGLQQRDVFAVEFGKRGCQRYRAIASADPAVWRRQKLLVERSFGSAQSRLGRIVGSGGGY